MDDKAPDIRIRLDSVLEMIETVQLRNLVSNIFGRLSELLDYLDFLESCLQTDELLPKSHLIVKFLNEKAESLVLHIESNDELNNHVDGGLRTLLDSTTFAIKHEVGRVFESGIPGHDLPHDELRTELTRAHGILRNCFQQSVIPL
jgi:hypothetical protein